MRLEGKSAVVTGGSSGIGRAIAIRFAETGARVIVLDLDEVGARETCDLIGNGARFVKVDLRSVAEIQAAFDDIIAAMGGVDVLVNCAGIFTMAPIEETTEEIWDSQMDVNLKAAFFCSRAVTVHMKSKASGKIINVSSVAGLLAFPNSAAYCASKGGVVNLTRALACELAPHRVNVNGIAPGNVESPMNRHLREGPGAEAWAADNARLTPSGVAFYKPNDIVGTAVFLASAEADALHGMTIAVDGGLHAW